MCLQALRSSQARCEPPYHVNLLGLPRIGVREIPIILVPATASLPLKRNCVTVALNRPQPECQSQNSPFCGSFAKSLASWHRNSGTPLRSNCFIRIRVIDMALVLQSQGMGT